MTLQLKAGMIVKSDLNEIFLVLGSKEKFGTRGLILFSETNPGGSWKPHLAQRKLRLLDSSMTFPIGTLLQSKLNGTCFALVLGDGKGYFFWPGDPSPMAIARISALGPEQYWVKQ